MAADSGGGGRASSALAEVAGWLGREDVGLSPLAELPSEVGWERSGGQALTAHGGRPPGDIAARMSALAAVLERVTADTGTPVSVDGPRLIGERERLSAAPHAPVPGRTLRGAGWMVAATDGWLALNVARPADGELFPALSGGTVAPHDVAGLVTWARSRRRHEVLEGCHLLGLAASAVPPRRRRASDRPWSETEGGRLAAAPGRPLVVADLSSLWAGPLATALLAAAGAHVLRIESAARPAVTASTDSAFAERLNGAKEHLVLDFDDRRRLYAVLAQADVVVLAARPRAIRQLGLRRRSGQLWVAITGYGSDSSNAHRIGFGDDAAASVGAVAWHAGKPNFCADALADPVTGLLAAVVTASRVAQLRAGRVDLSLSRSTRWAIAD